MSKQIGVGVISLGWMGRLHARSYRALAERYQGLEADVQLAAARAPAWAAGRRAARRRPRRPRRLARLPVGRGCIGGYGHNRQTGGGSGLNGGRLKTQPQ